MRPSHELVRLADSIDWESFDHEFGASYSSGNGRPGISTRLMVGLHYLKYSHDLSDEDTVNKWVENPYWQYLCGMKTFQHKLPIDPSSMTRWRKRVGEKGAKKLLEETIKSGLQLKAIKKSQCKRVNVDTTVQEKDIRFPTDARLYDRMRERLVNAARQRGINLRQSYVRVGKETLLKQSRYAHAKQMKRSAKATKKLNTYLGRVIRDVESKAKEIDLELANLLETAHSIHTQKRTDKNKVYSVHEPDVSCISKGKAHKRYEFGCKVGIATTSKGGWVLASQAFEGAPYDGHTLSKTISQTVANTGIKPAYVFVDRGYRGKHEYTDTEVVVDRVKRGRMPKAKWKWLKRRAAIEPTIGHLKSDCRMDRCRLAGVVGDKVNAMLSAAAFNFRKLLKFLKESPDLFWAFLIQLFFGTKSRFAVVA